MSAGNSHALTRTSLEKRDRCIVRRRNRNMILATRSFTALAITTSLFASVSLATSPPIPACPELVLKVEAQLPNGNFKMSYQRPPTIPRIEFEEDDFAAIGRAAAHMIEGTENPDPKLLTVFKHAVEVRNKFFQEQPAKARRDLEREHAPADRITSVVNELNATVVAVSAATLRKVNERKFQDAAHLFLWVGETADAKTIGPYYKVNGRKMKAVDLFPSRDDNAVSGCDGKVFLRLDGVEKIHQALIRNGRTAGTTP